ncbi:MAG: diguanylate cyclase [Burkholderiaceae bacterium]
MQFLSRFRPWSSRLAGALALVAGVLCAAPAAGVEPVRLQGCRPIELDGRHVEFFFDRHATTSVLEAQHADFRPIEAGGLNLGDRPGRLWLRLSVQGGGCDEALQLSLGNPSANRVLFYREAGPGEWVVEWASQLPRGAHSASRMRRAVLPIRADARELNRYLIEVGGPGSIAVVPEIAPGAELAGRAGTRMMTGGVFAGGIIALAAYCALLAGMTRLRGLLVFSISQFAAAVFYATVAGLFDGVAARLLPMEVDPFDAMLRVGALSVLAGTLFHTLFVRNLLAGRERATLSRPVLALLLGCWIGASLSILRLPVAAMAQLCSATLIASTVVCLAYLHDALVRRHPLARVLTVGCLGIGAATVSFAAGYHGMLPAHDGWMHLLALGAWFEAILLSVAVGVQVKGLQGQQRRLTAQTRELSLLSRTDPLTGLWNRRAYDAIVPAEVERCLRRGRVATMLVVDIDHFKQVNDGYGHGFGDGVIRALGTAIANGVRSTDFAFRYGGEEFVVLLPGLDRAMGDEVARRIAQSFAQDAPAAPDGAQPARTVSVGIAQLRPDDAPSALFERADAAMYRAKQNGRARVETDGEATPARM